MSNHPPTPIQQESKQQDIKTPLANHTRIFPNEQIIQCINDPLSVPLHPAAEQNEENHETHLDQSLKRLLFYLKLLGFDQSSYLRVGICWLTYLVIGVLIPVVILLVTANCLRCDVYQIKGFELVIVASHACLAAVALLCLSHNLRKYGIRKFLFVDQYNGHVERFSKEYIQKISILVHEGVTKDASGNISALESFISLVSYERPLSHVPPLESKCKSFLIGMEEESMRLLVLWVLPCLILKIARECIRLMYMHHESWWKSFSILIALTFSWAYVNFIYLSSCLMFHLVCNLQIIHFDDYGRLLETETDVLVFIEEHARLRHDLSKISHRFRIYLLLVFAVVTSSQFAMLFQITENSNKITFINGGDFAVSSISQVVGVILCLNAAAKISHRAQGVAALAARWHALASCGPDERSHMRLNNGAINAMSSESDLEAMNYIPLPTNMQLSSSLSSYHRRQAFVMYLQNNPGGITLYGWTVDRGLINTIFFIQLSLVLFVLGRTTVFTYERSP